MACRATILVTMSLVLLLGACSSSKKPPLDGSVDQGADGIADTSGAHRHGEDLVSLVGDAARETPVAEDARARDIPSSEAATVLDLASIADRPPTTDQAVPADRFDASDLAQRDSAGGDLPGSADTPADLLVPPDQAVQGFEVMKWDVPVIVPVDGAIDTGMTGDCSAVPGAECVAGQVETRACGTTVGICRGGTETRTCRTTCVWTGWSGCGGAYVGGSTEACGDGLDNDCDGAVDEGCGCNPVTPEAASSLVVSGTLLKLVADPAGCLLYGLTNSTPSELFVFDTANKTQLARIALGGTATDLDVSPDGTYVVAALKDLKQIAVVDKASWTIAPVATAYDVVRVEVANGGAAYYYSGLKSDLRGIDLKVGTASDRSVRPVNESAPYAPDLELSADGASLYYGESGTTGSNVYRLDLTNLKLLDQSRWEDGYGFLLPKQHVYLGPSGRHIFYADYELDGRQLGLVVGGSGHVLAEDIAATFAVSTTGILDAELLMPVAAFPSPIDAAALTAGDTELWYFSATTGQLSYANVADFIGRKALGVREAAARPIAEYTFSKLVADPRRPLLYGLDTAKRTVVSIDRQSGATLQSVVVGSRPTDLEIDPAGNYLYVGHIDTLAIARIDAKDLRFVGFVTTPRVTNDIVLLSNDRIGTIDRDQLTTPTLIDLVTGKVLDEDPWGASGGSLAATADGNSLFVNDTVSGYTMTRYDVSAGTLRQVARNEDLGGGSGILVSPDGATVHTSRYCLDGTDLTTIRYERYERMYSISPDGRLVTGTNKVIRAADGAMLARMSFYCPVQTISPDGQVLYCATASGIKTFPLAGLE